MENYVCEINAVYKKTKFKGVNVKNSLEVVGFIRKIFPKKSINHYESFGCLFLNSNNSVIGYKILHTGGIASSVIDIRLLFQRALICNSVSMIVFHNHPSGNKNPSKDDLEVSKKIKKAANFLDIKIIDNLIITDSEFQSIN